MISIKSSNNHNFFHLNKCLSINLYAYLETSLYVTSIIANVCYTDPTKSIPCDDKGVVIGLAALLGISVVTLICCIIGFLVHKRRQKTLHQVQIPFNAAVTVVILINTCKKPNRG